MKKEIRIALAFLLALVLLYLGINFLKGKNLFSKQNTYCVLYNNVTGLSTSSPVYTNGVRIGSVDAIDCNYAQPSQIVVRISVRRELALPRGTVARLDTELLGSVTMNLILPAPSANSVCYAPCDTIPGVLDAGMMATIGTLMPELRQLFSRADTLLAHANALASDTHVGDVLSTLPATLARVDALLAELRSTLTTYHAVGDNLDTLSSTLIGYTNDVDIPHLTAQLDSTLTLLQATAAQLQNADNTAGLLLTDPSLYENLNATCNEARTLIDDVRANPSRYINLSTLLRGK